MSISKKYRSKEVTAENWLWKAKSIGKFDKNFATKSAVQDTARKCYPKKNLMGLPVTKTRFEIVPGNSAKKLLLEKDRNEMLVEKEQYKKAGQR